MKFKDSYRKTNDEIHVREGLLDEIRAESAQKSSARKSSARQWLIAIPAVAVATAACLAVGFGVGRIAGKKDASRQADAVSANAPIVAEANEANNETEVFVANAEGDSVTHATEGDSFMLTTEGPTAADPTAPEPVGSYEALGEIMKERMSGDRGFYYGGDMPVAEDEAAVAAVEAPMEASEPMMVQTDNVKTFDAANGEAGRSYSGTNVQVEGIDEADIVKTDGSWIYVLNQNKNKIYILSAEGRDSEIVGTIKLREPKEKDTFYQYYSEMMLYGDRLYLLGDYNDWSDKVKDGDRQYAIADVYDISDRTAPKHLATHKQQGNYRTARLVGDLLVLVSDYHIWYWYGIDGEIPVREYCPKVVTNDEAVTLLPDEIYINPESKENAFTIVATINAQDGKEFDSHKAVLGGCSQVYCNGRDVLIASQEWRSDQTEEKTDKNGKHYVQTFSGSDTNLFRFTIEDGKIEAVAETKIPGRLLNQFSMDEYNGYYRFVVTRSESVQTIWTDGIDTYEWNSSSDCSLLVLDGNLNTVGKLDNLAKDEMVQSVRFMGDVAYFVTFRQVDPLFSADLSDPSNPKIIGKLKIPGFSAYLHPFGEGKLLGIGYDADEEHGWTENVKISMFDISDPSDVKEAFKLSVKDVNWTQVQYNHKIVFADVATQTVAFPADNAYYVFRVEGDSFKKIGEIQTDDDYWFGDGRGLFVEDAFYVIGQNEVTILSFETMEKLKTVKFK